MLGRVLERLEHAEVDGGLSRLRVPPDPLGFHIGGQRGAPRRGAERLGQAAVHQQGRVDPVREVPELLHRLLQVLADLLEHPLGGFGIRLGDLTHEVHAHGEHDEVLLRAVVQVALDGARRCRVAGFDDAGARPRSSSAWRRTSSSDSCSAESSFTLCSASPT